VYWKIDCVSKPGCIHIFHNHTGKISFFQSTTGEIGILQISACQIAEIRPALIGSGLGGSVMIAAADLKSRLQAALTPLQLALFTWPVFYN
jgi:hypothetical protein